LRGLEIGIMPNIPLPDSLTTKGPQPTVIEDLENTGGSGTPKKDQAGRTRSQDRKDSLLQEWGLPSGSSHADFFNPSKLSLRHNTQNWPKFKHHRTGSLQPICLKFQTTGKCKESCTYTHVQASSMEQQMRDAITERLQGIYRA
jgi:hypothetical protein